MNPRRKMLIVALLLCVAISAGMVVQSSLAYLLAQSDTLVNTFSAPYFPPEANSVEIAIAKTVTSSLGGTVSPEGYKFALENVDTQEIIHMTSDEYGTASVTLPFAGTDAGKTFTYKLSEVDGGQEDIIYSDAVYEIVVDVSIDDDNKVVAAATLDGKPVERIVAEFENIYRAKIPPLTGDQSQFLLAFAVLIASLTALVIVWRRKETSR